MNHSARISYAIMAGLFILSAWLHLGTLLLVALFGYFALLTFSLRKSKLVGITLYMVAIAGIGTGLIFFSRQAYVALPQIADTTIPAVVSFAEKNGVELPFSDYESLKTIAVHDAKEGIANIGRYIKTATSQFVLIVVGLVVAASLFLSVTWGTETDARTPRDSLYATVVRELVLRFKTFFQSFAKVIGAQIVISVINTGLTAIFVIIMGYPFMAVLVPLTFLCGLLPIIGNLISNTLIVGVGFTVSPKTALIALIFLVVIHNLEYFLNSKIIGDRIKTPMWLTLIGLVLGEKLMGIPGMILAPVVLHYIKVETSRNKTSRAPAPTAPPTAAPTTQ